MNNIILLITFLINYYILISIYINDIKLNFRIEYNYLYHLYIKYFYS